MSKVYNKIVQSNTEPSKNDIWLKDGQMKTFGKEGWKPVGGGSSLNANTPIKESVDGTELVPIFDGENKAVNVNELIKGGKEVYFLDVDNYKTPEDYNNLKAAFDSNKLIISQGSVINLGELPDGSLSGTMSLIISSAESNSDIQIFVSLVVFGTDGQVSKIDNSIILNGTGDGTKFLSDDGTYRIIASNAPYIFDYIGQATVTQDEYDGLKNAIINNNRILINSIEGIAEPTIKGMDHNIIVLIYTKPDATMMFTIDDTLDLSINDFVYINSVYFNEKITPLEQKITALEQKIAVLEGATA